MCGARHAAGAATLWLVLCVLGACAAAARAVSPHHRHAVTLRGVEAQPWDLRSLPPSLCVSDACLAVRLALLCPLPPSGAACPLVRCGAHALTRPRRGRLCRSGCCTKTCRRCRCCPVTSSSSTPRTSAAGPPPPRSPGVRAQPPLCWRRSSFCGRPRSRHATPRHGDITWCAVAGPSACACTSWPAPSGRSFRPPMPRARRARARAALRDGDSAHSQRS